MDPLKRIAFFRPIGFLVLLLSQSSAEATMGRSYFCKPNPTPREASGSRQLTLPDHCHAVVIDGVSVVRCNWRERQSNECPAGTSSWVRQSSHTNSTGRRALPPQTQRHIRPSTQKH